MGALLALASATLYGLSDVVGGVVSRRMSFVRVALLGQLGGLVVTAGAAPLVPSAGPTSSDLLWAPSRASAPGPRWSRSFAA